MPRKLSTIAPDWWDYTTLDDDLVEEAARLTPEEMRKLSRDGFRVVFYDTLEEFYLAEALEYISAWRQATPDNPVGICGPIGPTEQLPLVARLVNELGLSLKNAHFWGMDEWYAKGAEVPADHPLGFERADRELCFNRIRPELAMPEANLHFPKVNGGTYTKSWDGVRCAVMQGGQGETKHWAFNDPVRRAGAYKDEPPSSAEYRRLGTRVVELHPLTLAQNARTSGGGNITPVPTQALTVGPRETWKAEKVSIWHAGTHDNPFGQRLTTLMIGKRIADSVVPMSLLADHECIAKGEEGASKKGFKGPWMRSVEFQIIEGGTGDVILVNGFDRDQAEPSGPFLRTKITPGTRRWNPNGAPAEYKSGRIDWLRRDPEWKDVLGFRGAADAEKPWGQWNHLEAICDGGNITYFVNGEKVMEGWDGSYRAGRLMFQSEGAEIYFRKLELHPLRP